MKFFIAAPWRSKEMVTGLVQELTGRGYGVYSFLESGANLTTGLSIAEELKTFTDALAKWENDPNIRRIYESELQGIKESDAIIMLEPAGHSSLIEAGIGFGMGKKVFIVGTVEKPEVFYLISQQLYPDIPSFLADVERIAPK